MCNAHEKGNANKARTRCDECGRPMLKAHAVHDDRAYCGTCYAREFKPVPCDICGRTVRTPGGKGPARCKRCRNIGRACLRCGKPVPRAALTVEGGVACPSCARHFKPPQPCSVCGQLSLWLARDYKAGFLEPVCVRCRDKGNITCPTCGKHRRPAGTDREGRTVCKRCLEHQDDPFICPTCGKEGRRHSARKCEACYWEENAARKVKTAISSFTHEWVREAFGKFCAELVKRVSANRAALRIERYALFFAKLDATIKQPAEIDADGLIRLFGNDGLRRYAVPYGFLLREGLAPPDTEDRRTDSSEAARQAQLLRSAEGAWYHGVLERFHNHLRDVGERFENRGWRGKRRRFIPRTITLALHSARGLLRFVDEELGIGDVQTVDQIHLDRYLANHQGYRDGVRAFVRYLNRKEKLFRKLRVERASRSLPEGAFLERPRYRELVNRWLDCPAEEVKASLIGLLLLLYAQPVKRVVRIRLSELHKGNDGGYRILFGRTEITLDPRVGALTDRYLEQRKALSVMEEEWENTYLFPGRRHGNHLSEAAVTHHLRSWHVSAEQLFSSAIYYAYLSGMRHPKVLVKAFGITDTTAIKYLNLLNPRLIDEVMAKRTAHG